MSLTTISVFWNVRKQKSPIRTAKRKKNPKIMKIVEGASGTPSSTPTLTSWRCQKEKRQSKTLKTYLEKR